MYKINNKAQMWIFFDEIACDYFAHYGKDSEMIMVKDFKEYLSDFSKSSDIIILTRKNCAEVLTWFKSKNLDGFIYLVKNPEY